MTQHPLSREQIIQAREKLSEVFTILDEVGPLLDEPERGAALELRAQAADLLRRLGNLVAFLGAER